MVTTWLLIAHFIGDFLLQTDWMATNKSKNWLALLAHTSLYSLCFIPFGLGFALITFVLHTLTDAITSRITSKLWFFYPHPAHYGPDGCWLYDWTGRKRHWFFVMIGFDQLLHYLGFAFTLWCLQ